MNFQAIIMAIGVLAVSGICQAGMYKCTDPATGKVTYSQLPCAADAKKVDMDVHQPTAAQIQEAERIAKDNQAYIDAGIERRRAQLEAVARQRKMEALEAARTRELAAIQDKRARANNNLAGATWERALSQDAANINDQYNAEMDRLRGVR